MVLETTCNRVISLNMETYYLVLLALILYNAQVSANHGPPHGSETGVFDLHFDQDTGIFVGSNRLTCILVPLNKLEREELYTTKGMERIELMMIKDWVGVLPEVNIFRTDPLLSRHLLHWCGDKNIIMLQRTPSTATITASTPSSTQGTATPYTSTSQTFSGLHFDTTTKSVSRQNTLRNSITKQTTTHPVSESKHATQTTALTKLTTTPGIDSSTPMSPGYTPDQKHSTTTSRIPASATSQRTLRSTTQSSFGPYIIYDKSSNVHINAVIVDKDVCYVYHLTDTEVKLVSMGPGVRDAFERALLSKDRTNVLQNPLYINGAANQVQQTCKGAVFLLV